MAARLSDVLTGDVIFSPKSDAIFHGDPHAGNVYHVTGDPKNPYLIGLLDWGLMGTFPREDRLALMQLILGVQLGDAKRLHNNVGALLDHGLPGDPVEVQKIDDLIAEVIKPKAGRGSFAALNELLFGLIARGYATKYSLDLFIKSQITIAGELAELDPALRQDDLLGKQVRALVKKELPKRVLCTIWFPCWNSHGYTSLLSNSDVLAARRIPKKPKEAAVDSNLPSRGSLALRSIRLDPKAGPTPSCLRRTQLRAYRGAPNRWCDDRARQRPRDPRRPRVGRSTVEPTLHLACPVAESEPRCGRGCRVSAPASGSPHSG